LCSVNELFPVEVKKKEINTFSAFQKGTFSGTALDSKGNLFIGPKIKELTGPEREYYLGLAVDKSGGIYVGTGHRASVYKVNAAAPIAAVDSESNAAAEIAQLNELDVYALLVRDNGDIFAGTSPDGKLYKISNKGKEKTVTEFFNPEEKFIWDIKEDLAGNIILATGNAGGVFRINKEGSSTRIFTSEDTHIVSLFISKSGAILAGSGDRGILYKIDKTKAKVLFDSPFEEIRGICEDKDGNIFFTGSRGIKKQNILNDVEVETFLDTKRKKREKEEIIPIEKSIVYIYHPDGVVERLWGSETEYIYSACYDEKNNKLLIGTGNSGRVYSIDKEGGFSIIYESESAQVFKIAAMSGGFTLISNNAATVTRIEDALNSSGTYYSEVYDLGIQSKLGKIYWDAETGVNTNVSLYVRTGNSNVPDETWSKWSAPFTDSENSNISISGIRYFQVKTTLNSTNISTSPRLNNYKVYYVQSNLKPEIKKIDILKSQENSVKPSAAKDAAPAKRDENILTVQWSASDPNKDKLKYNVYLKKAPDRNWILLKEDITVPRTELDTRLFEDGKYLLKVYADDSLSNPPTMAKSAELISFPFLIDSTAPEISDFVVQGGHVTFTVNDRTSLVTGAFYSYDGKLWFPVFPVDLIADSRTESYDFSLTDKENNMHVFIKVIDEFNNNKVFQKEL
jgi:hypothetical protein